MSLGRPRHTHNCQDVQLQGTNLSKLRNNLRDIAKRLALKKLQPCPQTSILRRA